MVSLQGREHSCPVHASLRRLLGALGDRERKSGWSYSKDVCWDYVKRGGSCDREDCELPHEADRPIITIPPRDRWYALNDSFFTQSESKETKSEVNELLCELSKGHNPRCLVLDGPSCNTVRRSHTRAQ